jgi:hypothetical protein
MAPTQGIPMAIPTAMVTDTATDITVLDIMVPDTAEND